MLRYVEHPYFRRTGFNPSASRADAFDGLKPVLQNCAHLCYINKPDTRAKNFTPTPLSYQACDCAVPWLAR